jgi:hypothetical protein
MLGAMEDSATSVRIVAEHNQRLQWVKGNRSALARERP